MENKKAWNDKDVLNPKFLGSWDIPTGGTIIAKIIEAKTEEVDNFKTNKKKPFISDFKFLSLETTDVNLKC